MEHSKGNWKVSKTGGAVVTDDETGFEKNTGHGGQQAKDYYGGYLIAESILKPHDAILIAAAPEMLKILKETRDYIKSEGYSTEDIDEVIFKATQI